ncbi:MAG: redoxin domain-containing protein, partial [Flavobacteriaceae bacterium]|nr:redoxin domain-containing protein [Flavobacteriaceae bacterium]
MLKKNLLLFFVIILILSCKEAPKPIIDSRINDYALYDEEGNFHRLSFYNNNKAIVLFVQGNGCPIVRNAISDYKTIVEDYQEKGFKFFMINSNIQDNRTSIKKEAESFGFNIPVLVDSAQLIADELDIKITGEVIILHPTKRTVLYRGPINDRLDYESQKDIIQKKYLRNTLDLILETSEITENNIPAKGCKVTRLSSSEERKHLTYSKDIAPILADRCVKCHNENGIAPWSMSNYNMVNGWSSMMKEVLLSKRMPPWNADPEVGDFKNSLLVSDSNVRKIIRWIDEGREFGEGIDTLETIKPATYEWKAGKPDTIINLKQEKIPAT